MKKFQIYPLALVIFMFSQTACGQSYVADSPKANTNVADGECQPLERREPNAEEQKRSFPEQTRACAVSTKTELEVSEIATGLSRPWAVEPLPDGDFIVTEKGGNLRLVTKDGKISEPLKGVIAVGQGGITEDSKLGGLPPVTARGQGGLLDVALSPNFKSDKTIFWSFSERRKDGTGTSVARGVLNKETLTVENVKIIFRALPSYRNGLHFGSRIAFDKEGLLYVTTGDRFDRPNRAKVQTLENHYGKVMRIKVDGSVPDGNPFAKIDGAKPEVWTLGHRNIQSAVFDGNGRLWTVEHGARGGDELNLIEKGKNYGWPVVTFGQEYSGSKIRNSQTKRDGYVDPVYYWDPVIAPSGMEYYDGDMISEWKGSIFIGGLASQRLVRVVIKDDKVVGEEHLLTDRRERVRDVRQGPDGSLFVVTDARNGKLIKISAKK